MEARSSEVAAPPPARAPSPSDSVARSAGIVSIAVGFSRISGLVREKLMAHLFGAGFATDAYQIAFRLPNLTRDLFAEGALSSAFIPVFTEYLTKRGKKEAAELMNLVATALIVIVGALCILGVLASPQLVELTASGYHQVPGKYELTVRMTRIMFPFLLLVALAAQVMGVLNACNVFAVPAMASTFFNIGSVLSGLFFGFVAGPFLGISKIEGMAWGVVAGGACQLLWQIPALSRAGFSFRPQFNWSHPGLRRIFRLMGPAILGSAGVQINVMVNTYFATHLNDPVRGLDGPASWLFFAFRFMQLPLGLFGVAIGSATLPAISRSAARGDMDEFRRTLSRSLGLVFLLTVPSSIGLIVLGKAMIGSIYQGGRFTAYDTMQTGRALSFYAVGLAGYSALKVLTPAFYALNDTRTPMLVSLFSIIVNFAAVSLLTSYGHLGHAGLALSTSVVSLCSFLLLFWTIRSRIGGINGRDLLNSMVKIAFASCLMGLLVTASSLAVHHMLGEQTFAHLVDLIVSIPLGLAAFYFTCQWMRIAEFDTAVGAIVRPLTRRFPFLRARMRDNAA